MPRKAVENGENYKTGKWLKEEEETLKDNARVSSSHAPSIILFKYLIDL